ncbi:MAG: glycosyltransferase family 2 protein [Treponema sp.]|nr:glycosyltransferase family 2 protein [Treponema sp.]
MADFYPCILIPVYRHGRACEEVVNSITQYNFPIILVDDGNESETKAYLSKIKENHNSVELVTLPKNQGKGGAFKAGVIRAKELGFSHILQLDADGQHDSSQIPFFVEKSKNSPEKMICGYPDYDETAPGHRKGGHKFANTWCAIVTWSDKIVDSLCGFRIYPTESTYAFVTKKRFDKRMGFDLDILLQMMQRGVDVEFYPVKVTYPTDGISNFHAFRDNVRISWIFTKLFAKMILTSPLMLWRKILGISKNCNF